MADKASIAKGSPLALHHVASVAEDLIARWRHLKHACR